MYARTSDGDFILPMMREAMNTIIADNTHLTERCEAMLASLNSDLARPLEPSYDELNPPPEPEKEYRFSLGDTVYLGTHEYEVLSFDENEVVLYPSKSSVDQRGGIQLRQRLLNRRQAETVR